MSCVTMKVMRINQYCVILLLLTTGCEVTPRNQTAPIKLTCPENMSTLSRRLRAAIPVAPDYPPSLNDVLPLVYNRTLFVCPDTGNRPGSSTNVADWSDYIYIGNLPDLLEDTRVPLLICPPENNHEKCGYVVWLDGSVSQLSSEETRRLIAAPFMLATKIPTEKCAELRKRVVVQVPRRFYNAYTHRTY